MDEQFHLSSKKTDTAEWMKEVLQLSMYYDFYGELLSEHHKRIFEDYILNDMSLGEIAEEMQMTRQGVYDVVKRVCKKLHEYEKKLQLVERFVTLQEKVEEISSIARQMTLSGEAEVRRCAGRVLQLTEAVRSDL